MGLWPSLLLGGKGIMNDEIRRKLEADMCVDGGAWAAEFMKIKDDADLHEVKLWFASCLRSGFICGQREPRYASLQKIRPS